MAACAIGAGLRPDFTNVPIQPLDLPPQWMPQSLTPIVLDALKTFGVGTRAGISASPAGEIGRVYQFAPSMQIIEADFYYHTDAETDDVVPPSGLESTTRAYAKMIDEVNKVSLSAIRAGASPRPSTSR